MELITLKVEGMKCGMCESHVCDYIRKVLPKAKKVKANHMKNTASFVLEQNGVDIKPVMDEISSGGYHVEGFTRDPYEKKGLFSFLKK
jgi:copper chaperone CopZ